MIRPSLRIREHAIWAILLLGCNLLCAQGIAIRTDQLPWAIKGEPYSAEVLTSVSGRCPHGDVRLSVVAGELPRGLQLFSFGFEGTPLQIGSFQFTLQASNDCGTHIRRMKLLVTGRPILLVSPQNVVFDQPAGGDDNSAEDILKVEGSWPDLPYSIAPVNAAPWLTALPMEGKTPDPDSAFTGDRVQLGVNAANLAPGVYHATLKFYAQGGENAPTVDVTLHVHKAE